MMNAENNQIHSSILVNKSIVYEYFRLIKNKDIDGLLSLFADDAVVREPFSNIIGGLQGKAAIRPFLEIAIMANNGLAHTIAIEKPITNNNHNESHNEHRGHYNDDNDSNSNNKVTALVTFQRGDSMRAKFTFEIVPVLTKPDVTIKSPKNKIRSLDIQFIM